MPEVQECPWCAMRVKATLDVQEDVKTAVGDGDNAQTQVARELAGVTVQLVPYRDVSNDAEEVDL